MKRTEKTLASSKIIVKEKNWLTTKDNWHNLKEMAAITVNFILKNSMNGCCANSKEFSEHSLQQNTKNNDFFKWIFFWHIRQFVQIKFRQFLQL